MGTATPPRAIPGVGDAPPIALDQLARKRIPMQLPTRDDGTPGRVVAVRAFRARDFELWAQLDGLRSDDPRATPLAAELLRRVVPGLTDEELDELEPAQGLAILVAAAGAAPDLLAAVREALAADERLADVAAGVTPGAGDREGDREGNREGNGHGGAGPETAVSTPSPPSPR